MPTLGENLKKIRKAKGFTQESLSKKSGVKQSVISDLETGTAKTTGSILELAAALGVSAETLKKGVVDNSELSAQKSAPFYSNVQAKPVIAWEAPEDLDSNTYVIIPHVDVKFSAGDGHIVEYEPVQNAKCSAQTWDWIQKKRISPKNLITVDIDGDSMEPNIKNGSIVTLDKSINTLEQVQSGKVYAIRYGNELKIKRLSRRFDGALIIDSDNPDYEREIVELDQLEHISIIGKYVSHSYDGEI